MTTKVCYDQEKSVHLTILLSEPRPEEQCPITAEAIGASTFSPPYAHKLRSKKRKSLTKRARVDSPSHNDGTNSDSSSSNNNNMNDEDIHNEPFSDCPKLLCAQLAPCGHRFDARALLIHFMRNNMCCPICRAGLSVPLSAKRSFPEEPWICEMEEAIQEEARHEKNNQINEDIVIAMGLERADYYTLPNLILGTLLEHRVAVSFFFFNTPNTVNAYPVHAMQIELELLPLQIRHRDLGQGISLYSSFSSSSLLTPNDRPSSPVITDSERWPGAQTFNHADSLPQEHSPDNHHSSRHFIMIGGHILSLDDVSVQYVMSEPSLR